MENKQVDESSTWRVGCRIEGLKFQSDRANRLDTSEAGDRRKKGWRQKKEREAEKTS